MPSDSQIIKNGLEELFCKSKKYFIEGQSLLKKDGADGIIRR
jgi:hypothetical protein